MGSVKSPASQILLHHSISLFSLYCTSSPDISSYGGDGGVYLRKYFFLSCEKKCICKDESSFTGKEEIEEEYLSRNVNCSLERRSVFARKYIFLSSFCPFSGIPSASHWLHRHLIPLHYLHWPSFQNRATLQPLSLWDFLIRKGKYQTYMALFPKQSYSQTTFSMIFLSEKKKHTYLVCFPKQSTMKLHEKKNKIGNTTHVNIFWHYFQKRAFFETFTACDFREISRKGKPTNIFSKRKT